MIDFQQVSQQVHALGEKAPERARQRYEARQKACELLAYHANELVPLRQKVALALRYDDKLRCAVPLNESLMAHIPAPALPSRLVLLAADGSQINPNPHDAVQYGLINVGIIQMAYGFPNAPSPTIRSELFYDEALYDLTESLVALRRDLAERRVLADLAEAAVAGAAAFGTAQPSVLAMTDGPLELWGAKDDDSAAEFGESLKDYLAALNRLQRLGAANAGYVDKPNANLVVRLLEVVQASGENLENIRHFRPWRMITDRDLYADLLAPGERSAVFEMQSKSAEKYTGGLALRFFYLNVGRREMPWLARVEIPAWVAEAPETLDALHAVLLDQCRTMGAGPYPYLLHRAHETAVVTHEEKAQITQMIVHELRRRGVTVGEMSHKQVAKDLPGRTRYG
ncbi:MAG: DNA double-strand break repair nuclease NurA [Chloroflexota bacterium]